MSRLARPYTIEAKDELSAHSFVSIANSESFVYKLVMHAHDTMTQDRRQPSKTKRMEMRNAWDL